MTPTVRLTGRSSSHFTRVARIFADELSVPVVYEPIHDLRALDPSAYGGHPGLKIPTLHVGDSPLFGTENICRRLAELAGRDADPRVVLGHHTTTDLARSAQELVWQAMSAQVQLVLGTQLAKLPAENVFFAKIAAGLLGVLAWLDGHLVRVVADLPGPRELSLLETTTFCMMEHLVFRPTVPLDGFPTLRGFAADFSARPSAQRTPYHYDR